MLYCSVDTETSGLDPIEDDILEFAAILDDTSHPEIPVDNLPRYHCYFIKEKYVGSPFALSMHPTIFRRIAERGKEENRGYRFMSATKFGNSFKLFLVDNGYKEEHGQVVINAAGKNFASFDFQFLKYKTDFLKHINVRHRIIDPAILYWQKGDDALPGMTSCLERAGTVKQVSHNAIDDAIDVVNLVRKVFNSDYFCE